MKPLHSGIALSVTVAVFYSLCTLAEVAWPQQFMGFMNALFHGLDFRFLATQEPYRWSSFIYALVVLTVWAFAVGAFFAWFYNTISATRFHHIAQHE